VTAKHPSKCLMVGRLTGILALGPVCHSLLIRWRTIQWQVIQWW